MLHVYEKICDYYWVVSFDASIFIGTKNLSVKHKPHFNCRLNHKNSENKSDENCKSVFRKKNRYNQQNIMCRNIQARIYYIKVYIFFYFVQKQGHNPSAAAWNSIIKLYCTIRCRESESTQINLIYETLFNHWINKRLPNTENKLRFFIRHWIIKITVFLPRLFATPRLIIIDKYFTVDVWVSFPRPHRPSFK